MKLKRVFCILLAIIIAVFACGCKSDGTIKKGKSSDKVDTKNIRTNMNLLYNASDSFNPYTAKTDLNRQLCKLLYEPLIRLDNNYDVVKRLASDYAVSGNTCSISLVSAKFSDGTNVTANDVVYSFNFAKGNSLAYASKLSEFASATAVNDGNVNFNLTRIDPYCINLLDFPIIKNGTGDIEDVNSKKLNPTGCGRYTVNQNGNQLDLNKNFYGKKSSIKKINLINAPDNEAVDHFIEIGASDIYYNDISDGRIVRMSGQKFAVNLNNMVYIGINSAYAELANPYVRYAISSAIDRTNIVKNAYYTNATVANGFFNPLWKEVSSLENLLPTADTKISIENLSKIGYNDLDASGARIGAGGGRLSFSLLVNAENASRVAAANLIAQQLLSVGILVTVQKTDYANYLACLQSGNFQLYVGEVAINPNMDISPLVVPGGSSAYGVVEYRAVTPEGQPEVASPPTVSDVINGYYGGKNSIADVATILQSQMPIVPVCFRTGVLLCNKKIKNIKTFSASDIYLSEESYIIEK